MERIESKILPRAKGPRTAARILEVALEHFSALGFERATLGAIAAEAGVSQASLHHHFLDKADLWRSAMLQLRTVIAQEERLLDAVKDASPLARLRAAMRFFLQISWDHPALGRIVMLEGMAGGERLEWLDRNLIGPRNRRLAKLAATAIAAKELKPFPPEQLIVTLQCAGAGVINLSPMMRVSFGADMHAPAAREAHDEMIMEAFLGGLVIQPVSPGGNA